MDLDNSERRFQMLVKGVTDYAIYMLDPDGLVVSWNAGAERIKGYSAEEIIGSHFGRFYCEEDRAVGRPARALQIARSTGSYEEEGSRVRKDGSKLLAHVVIDPVYDEARQLIGYAKVTRDVTEKKQLERQLLQSQKMEAVGQLTGGIAHDFNNILSVIIGNLDTLLENHEQAEAVKNAASAALDAALGGAQLIHHLLAFSRNQTLQPRPMEVSKILADAEPLVRSSIGERIEFEISSSDDIWPVLADPGQLESVILNLAINARDAMPDGGRLRVRCSNVSLDEDKARQEDLTLADYVCITVSDTGTGIPPELLDRVFEPFYTTKETGKGSGLGLSMVYGFARQSGGTAKVYSEPSYGTEVRVYLPRAIGEGASASSTAVDTSPLKGKECVLVVEDREDVRKIAVSALRSLGYDVVEVDGGEAAIEVMDQGAKFDLLFTDVVMPKMNGMDLAWAVRRRRPDVPIILTSGFSDPDLLSSDLVSIGATLIAKPYRKADLARHVRMALDRQPLRSAA